MTATYIVHTQDKEETETLAKIIKKLIKGSVALENLEATPEGLKISYRLTKEYTFKKDKASATSQS
jgi:hypothetical protein